MLAIKDREAECSRVRTTGPTTAASKNIKNAELPPRLAWNQQVPTGVVGPTVKVSNVMNTAQYVSCAEECFRMALIAKSKSEETAWLEISSSWLRLAGLNDPPAQQGPPHGPPALEADGRGLQRGL